MLNRVLDRYEKYPLLPQGNYVYNLKKTILAMRIQTSRHGVTQAEFNEAQTYVARRTAKENAWEQSLTGQLESNMSTYNAHFADDLPTE